VPILELRRAPIRHPELPESLVWRIRAIRAAIWNVYPLSIDQWIDGFKRDSHPSNEVERWEALATVFMEVSLKKGMNLANKKKLYKMLLSWICGENKETIANEAAALPLQVAILAFKAMRPYEPSEHDELVVPVDVPQETGILISEIDDEGLPDRELFEGDITRISSDLIDVLARREVAKEEPG
jgi:hypothetical protein